MCRNFSLLSNKLCDIIILGRKREHVFVEWNGVEKLKIQIIKAIINNIKQIDDINILKSLLTITNTIIEKEKEGF